MCRLFLCEWDELCGVLSKKFAITRRDNYYSNVNIATEKKEDVHYE